MVTELAEIEVKLGQEAPFEAAVAQAATLFLESAGCRSFELRRSLEQPTRYRIFVEWETVEDHMIEFRNSPAFVEWRRLVVPFFASPPRVEHLVVAISHKSDEPGERAGGVSVASLAHAARPIG